MAQRARFAILGVLFFCLGTALARPAAADASALCVPASAYEPVETRCDGLDNDCDGLVDVLLPVAENECQSGNASSCRVGHAACLDGERVCLAPGPAPEVADGEDNDCNGVIDDVGSTPPLRSRALMLVPGYAFSDAASELDMIASILSEWGIAYDRGASPEDFDRSLGSLSQYPLVVIPGYLEEDFLVPFRQQALEDYAAQGGVLVVFKPIFDAGSPTQQLIGTTSTERRSDVDTLLFDGARNAATRAFDSPEEVRVPIASGESSLPLHVFTPAAGTETLAAALVNGVSVGAVVTRRSVGEGAIYAVGHDLHSSFGDRCYINCFEPAGDLAGLFLREALREGTHGHVVLKHTVSGLEDSTLVLTHDVDAFDAQQSDPAWGDPGALQVAALESQAGAYGNFFVTTDYLLTDYSIPYYSPSLMQTLCALDMCPAGAHSVTHLPTFAALPLGSCSETAATYDGSDFTLCGEIRVPFELLLRDTGTRPIAWRSPYLDVHPAQYDVLASQGVLYDSSYAVGDVKFNLPVSLAHTQQNQQIFQHQPPYTMSIALEDGIETQVPGGLQREEMSAASGPQFTTLWSYAMLRNADNGAHTLSLLHPSYGLGQPQDNLQNKLAVLGRYIAAAKKRRVKIDTRVDALARFWQAREEVDVDARYSSGRYEGTLATGEHPVQGLTLEFGDALTSFECASCGDLEVAGKRVLLRATLPARSAFSFDATAGVTAAAAPAVPAFGLRSLIVLFGTLLLVAFRRQRNRLAGLGLAAAALLGSVPAAAQSSPYCEKVRERAADDAALLMAPRAVAEVLRFPNTGVNYENGIVGSGFQPRVGLEFSATNLYKGFGVLELGDAACREQTSRVALEAGLVVGDGAARRAGLAEQIAYLEAHRADVEAAVTRAEARFSERTITLLEFNDLRTGGSALELKLAHARGELRKLDAELAGAPPNTSLDRLEHEYRNSALALADAEGRVRAADPWDLQVNAGIIPLSPPDWYGVVELGFNLGGVTRPGHAGRYTRARAQELEHAPYEQMARLERQQAELRAALEQTESELAVVERDLGRLAHARETLENSDAPNLVHQRERIAIEQMTLEAERAYYVGYARALRVTLSDRRADAPKKRESDAESPSGLGAAGE
jgi:hypothetical protein